MILLDLALQGFRELSGSVRVRLQSGYTVIATPATPPETMIEGLAEVLYFAGPEARLARLAAPGGPVCSAGATMMAADGGTFRVMVDFGKGAAQLLEFNRESKTFAALMSDPLEISRFVQARIGLPPRPLFEAVYLLRSADLPSQAAARAAAAAATRPDPDVVRARLAELEQAIAEHEEIEQLEYTLDGLQKQKFAVEDRLQALVVDTTELEEARVQAHRFAYLDVLPEEFAARYEEVVKLQARRKAELERWQAERESIEGHGREVEVEPLLGSWRLWLGLLGGVGAVVVAAVLGGLFRWLALLDIPAFGWVAILLFRNLSQREARGERQWRLRLSDQRREKLLARDQAEIGAVEALLKQVELDKPEEVRAALRARQEAKARLTRLEAAHAAAERNPERAELQQQRQALEQQIQALEEKLTRLSLSGADLNAMRAEATHLRAQLAELAQQAAEEGSGCPMGGRWLHAARELLLSDQAAVARSLSERAALLVRVLSDNRLQAVTLAADGAITIQPTDGAPTPWAEMPAAAQDLAYLALRGALFLSTDQRSRSPMVCADLAPVIGNGLVVVQALLTTLAHGGQVVHVVKRAEGAPGAKHVAVAEAK